MKFFPLVLILVVAGWMACNRSGGDVNYRLTDDQLARLMFDIQLGEVAVSEVDVPTRRDSMRTLIWSRLSGIYQLPEAELKEEVRKLEEDPDKMKLILDRTQVIADSIR